MSGLVLTNWGTWDVGNVRVTYHSPSWVQFSCKALWVNDDTKIRNVFYTIFDRIAGRSFDEKVDRELQKFIDDLMERNKKIIALREKERMALSRIQNE